MSAKKPDSPTPTEQPSLVERELERKLAAHTKAINRLKRAQGQLNGVIAAMEDGASCREVITQLSAVDKAIRRAGYVIVSNAMDYCLIDDESARSELSEAEARQAVTRQELEKIFLMMA